MAFLITAMRVVQGDTPIFGGLTAVSSRPIIKSDHIGHMLHSINVRQEST